MPEPSHTFDATDAAARLRALRAELLPLLEALPETRLGRALQRPGWTLRHELAALAAGDAELPHVLETLRTHGEAEAELALRRLRGEAMLLAQQMRLHVMREHLAAGVHQAADALERSAELLDRPVSIAGRDAHSVREYIAELLAQAESTRDEVRAAIGQ